MDDDLVIVDELEKMEGGGLRIGASCECSVAEAVEKIKAGKAKAPNAPMGHVPEEWGGKPEKKGKTVAVEEVEEHGIDQ